MVVADITIILLKRCYVKTGKSVKITHEQKRAHEKPKCRANPVEELKFLGTIVYNQLKVALSCFIYKLRRLMNKANNNNDMVLYLNSIEANTF